MIAIAILVAGLTSHRAPASGPIDRETATDVDAGVKRSSQFDRAFESPGTDGMVIGRTIVVPPEPARKQSETSPRDPQLSPVDRHFENDEYPTLEWSGFLQLDSGIITQDEANEQQFGKIGSKTGLRRVRLRAQGLVRAQMAYRVDLDFAASGHPSFRDVGLHFGDIPYVQNVQFGYFRQPFGMDAMTSGRRLILLERQLPFAFAPFRQTGVGAYGASDDERTTYAFSVFALPTDNFGVTMAQRGGGSLATRVTHLLAYQEECSQVLHVGGGYVFGDPADDIVRYKIQPGFFVSDPSDTTVDPTAPVIVDTGNIPSSAFHLLNLEVAAASGPFRIISEGRVALVKQITGPSLAFTGAYVQLGYLVTGEHQNYDRQAAVFGGIDPLQEFQLGRAGGAVELTCGWSFIDLTDKNIDGGNAQTLLFGVNWYLNRHVKFVFGAGPTFVRYQRTGSSRAFTAAARTQVEF